MLKCEHRVENLKPGNDIPHQQLWFTLLAHGTGESYLDINHTPVAAPQGEPLDICHCTPICNPNRVEVRLKTSKEGQKQVWHRSGGCCSQTHCTCLKVIVVENEGETETMKAGMMMRVELCVSVSGKEGQTEQLQLQAGGKWKQQIWNRRLMGSRGSPIFMEIKYH